MKDNNIFRLSIIFCLSFVFLAAGSNYNINIYDEGIGIVGSLRIINGDLPYLDFWTVYSPGWYYFQAAFMQVFGDSMIAVRMLSVSLNSLCVLLIFIIMESQSKKPYFVSLSALMLISLVPSYGRALPLAILILLGGFYFLINAKNIKQYVYAGILAGLLFTVRHDFAVYFTFSATVYIFFAKRFIEDASSVKPIIALLGSFSAVVLAFALSLYSANILNEYFLQAYVFPFKYFSETRALPLPVPFSYLASSELSYFAKIFGFWNSIIFYTVAIFIGMGFYALYTKKIDLHKDGKLLLSAMLCGMTMSMQGLTRSDFEHILPATLLALLLIPILLDKYRIFNKYLLFGLLLFMVLPPTMKKAQSINNAYFSSSAIELKSGKSNGIKVAEDFGENYNGLLEYLSIYCRDDYLYSGALHHNKIFINDVMLYYLSGKKPAVAYHELHPRQATEAAEQQSIINRLELLKVNWIVLLSSEYSEEKAFSMDGNVFLLDDYLRENYILRKIFGNYFVYERK